MRKKMISGGPAEKSDFAKLAKKLGPRKLKSGPVKTGEKSKPISRSKNPGLLAMSKTAKGKEAVKKMKFNPNRIVAKKGGKA